MNLKRATVERYAQGTAPFAGIPIAGVGTVVFRRDHLKAALDINPSRIIYNADTKTITFRNHRSVWKLNDLLGQGKFQRWQLKEQITSWAKARRSANKKRKESAALGKEGRYVRRLREAVAKLQHQREKICLHPPHNPVLYKRQDAGDYSRGQFTRWIAEKTIRKELAQVAGHKLLHGEPKTWADFYREVERVSGHHVDESQTFTRVHARKRYRHGLPDYPDRDIYLKHLPQYLVMAEKPWDWRRHDLYKPEYGGPNPLQRHAQARLEYCAALRERMSIDLQIANHLAEIESAKAVPQ